MIVIVTVIDIFGKCSSVNNVLKWDINRKLFMNFADDIRSPRPRPPDIAACTPPRLLSAQHQGKDCAWQREDLQGMYTRDIYLP